MEPSGHELREYILGCIRQGDHSETTTAARVALIVLFIAACLPDLLRALGIIPAFECNDGTHSFSRNRRGTCSWHKGIRH
jgi:hypothetical protein